MSWPDFSDASSDTPEYAVMNSVNGSDVESYHMRSWPRNSCIRRRKIYSITWIVRIEDLVIGNIEFHP
jgi:hypothetical protein